MNNIYKTGIINIQRDLKEYIQKYNLKSLVIGESGGIDSALCSALAYPVCKELGIDLIGRTINIETNKVDELERGISIGEHFCTDFDIIDWTDEFLQLKSSCEFKGSPNNLVTKLRQGNIKARMRMIYLYDLAQKNKGLVISTDNYTEYLLGFWTLHGDVGDYGLIQPLWKMEVYAFAQCMVDHLLESEDEKKALQSCIDAIPTDGLGISNSDLDQLGASSYKEVDEILKTCLEKTIVDASHPVVQRYYSTGYKRNNPLNISRESVFGNRMNL